MPAVCDNIRAGGKCDNVIPGLQIGRTELHRHALNIFFKGWQILVGLRGLRIHIGVVGIGKDTGKYLNPVCPVFGIERPGPVLFEKGFTFKKIHISEHGAVVHMVSVDQGVGVAEIRSIGGTHEDGSREDIFAENIFVQILVVIFALYDRVIDMGAVYGDPSPHIRINRHQLLECIAVLLCRLEIQHVGAKSHMIDHPVVPEGKAAIGQQQQYHDKGNPGKDPVADPGQKSCSLQQFTFLKKNKSVHGKN